MPRVSQADKERKAAIKEGLSLKPANPVQKDFILCTKREQLMDGGVGSGKTIGGLIKLLLLANKYPGSSWFVARQTYKDLIATTKKSFEKIVPKGWVVKDVLNVTTLWNGSTISWNHLDDFDLKTLMGLEITGAFIDQAEEISPDMWEALSSRIGRWNTNPEWDSAAPAYIWATSNPNGKDWLYWRFHPDVVGEHPDRAYFFIKSTDNKECLDKFSPGYLDNLLKKSPEWRKRWVEGSREIFEGKIFPEFLPNGPHIYNPKEFDPYKRYGATSKQCWSWMDYGLTSPTTLLITLTTTDGFVFVTSEYGAKNKMVSEHAAEIISRCKKNPIPVKGTFADPSIFAESTRDRAVMTTSVAKEFNKFGVYPVKADNNEETSIAILHEMLYVNPTRKNPITGQMGSPILFISDECKELIKELDMQRHDEERNPMTGEREWVSSRNERVSDHYFDPLRYFANSKIHNVSVSRTQPRVPSYVGAR
jgi:hypothetical protein